MTSVMNHNFLWGVRKSSGLSNMWTSTFSFFLNSTIRFFVPALLPLIISSLHISVYSGSILITSYWIGYTALQIPAGYLADRYGTAKVSKLSFLFLFVSFMLMPLAVNNYI